VTRWLNRVSLASGVVRILEENLTADHSRPTGVEGATLHENKSEKINLIKKSEVGMGNSKNNF
jgi:hypothetical protein